LRLPFFQLYRRLFKHDFVFLRQILKLASHVLPKLHKTDRILEQLLLVEVLVNVVDQFVFKGCSVVRTNQHSFASDYFIVLVQTKEQLLLLNFFISAVNEQLLYARLVNCQAHQQ
jgi:hypothetical protein